MYKRNAQGWLKHFDFNVIDELFLQIAFIVAVVIRNNIWAYSSVLYLNLAFVLVLIDAFVLVVHNSMHNVISRSYYQETIETFKHCFYVFAIATIYMFATQTGDAYSRIVLFLTFLLHIVLGYVTRIFWKVILKKRAPGRVEKHSMLVVVAPETAESILQRLSSEELSDYKNDTIYF